MKAIERIGENSGAKVLFQFASARSAGRYVANVVDGKVTLYGRRAGRVDDWNTGGNYVRASFRMVSSARTH